MKKFETYNEQKNIRAVENKKELDHIDPFFHEIASRAESLFEAIKNSSDFSEGEKIILAEEFRIIARNAKELEMILESFEPEIGKNNHFNHVIGNFVVWIKYAKEFALGKFHGEEDDLVGKAQEYRLYFSECVTNKRFLAEELTSEEGAAKH